MTRKLIAALALASVFVGGTALAQDTGGSTDRHMDHHQRGGNDQGYGQDRGHDQSYGHDRSYGHHYAYGHDRHDWRRHVWFYRSHRHHDDRG